MSLERYAENGWLKTEVTSAHEIADLRGVVARSLGDAKVDVISDDLRFYTAFNAALALATIALRASGYRTSTQQGHHQRTLETLEYTIGADGKLIRKLMAFSKKRNTASYDSAGTISREELRDILTTVDHLEEDVRAWVRAKHPSLWKD